MVNFTLSHGMDTDGGLFDEGHEEGGIAVPNKVWWVQAEAVVGSVNAWQITGDEKYLDSALKSWAYIKAEIINGPAGEWFASRQKFPGRGKFTPAVRPVEVPVPQRQSRV